MPDPLVRGLYLITPEAMRFEHVLETIAAAVRQGVRIVQYRDKRADRQRRWQEAHALLSVCEAAGAALIINDDVALCEHVGAHGVHLGRHDGGVAAARARLGPRAVIGASCYGSLGRARDALRSGASYVAFGSVWPSPTKPDAPRASLDTLSQARRSLPCPIVAIGGISTDNAAITRAAGADALAVISAVFCAPQPAATVRQFGRALAGIAIPGPDRASPSDTPQTRQETPVSHADFEEAKNYIPGGVNSPVRAFGNVGGDPVFVERAKGARFWSRDGQEYVDYVGSWGPMILGHADDAVIEAVREAALDGLSFGAPTVSETRLAKLVQHFFPGMARMRMVSSGTEATMSALRLARGFTGRDKIIKFEGCYHGHADALLVKAGSGALTLGVPSSGGVPAGAASDTLTATFNDLQSVATLMRNNPGDIACVIVEPIAGNMNFVPAAPGFLEGLRALCDEHEALLIFDEVMTGFRVAPGGVQSLYGVEPDVTTLGKIVGGGMPVGVFGGRLDVMNAIAPLGPVYQAGTLSGNPVAMAAGIATLTQLKDTTRYDGLADMTAYLVEQMVGAARDAGLAMYGDSRGGMFGLFFGTNEPVTNYDDVMACDKPLFTAFFHAMLKRGVYFAPSSFEAGFVSMTHTRDDIDHTVAMARETFREIAA